VHAAEDYPAKTIKFVVNFQAGGPIDVIARIVADKLKTSFKHPVIVENSPGAGGNIGANNVAKAEPDGYTVLFTIDTPLTMNPSLYGAMPFKAADLKPVIMMGSAGSTIVANPAAGMPTLKDMIARGKSEAITFSSAGNGSPGHVAAAMLAEDTGVKVNHIPYRGNAPAVLAVVSGEVQAGILATSGVLPQIKAGKVKALAVAASRRSAQLPDVPTTAELGYPGVEMEFLFVAMVPAKTPDAVVNTLHKAIASAMAQADVQERLRNIDIAPSELAGPQVADRLARLQERYARIIKTTGMKAE
jgi:tripartite-type tricarboxylate transporter receptor subunit TctC